MIFFWLLYPAVCLLLGTLSGALSWWTSAAMNAVVVLILVAAALRAAKPPAVQRGEVTFATTCLALLLAAGTLRAPSAARSWRLLLLFAAAAAVFTLAAGVVRRRGTRALTYTLAATGTAAATWGLIDFAWGASPRVAAPLGHHNYMAGFLLLHLPLTGGALWEAINQIRVDCGLRIADCGFQAAKSARRALASEIPRIAVLAAAAVIQAIALILTGSLAGIILFTMLAVWAFAQWITPRRAAAPIHRRSADILSAGPAASFAEPQAQCVRPSLEDGAKGPADKMSALRRTTLAAHRRLKYCVAGGVTVALCAMLVALQGAGSVLGGARDRALSIVTSRTDPSLSLENRIRYARAGIAMFAERPVLGWGLGSVPLVSSLYREQTPGVAAPGEALPQLHSLPVNLLAETGVLGLVGFCLLAWLVIACSSGSGRVALLAYALFSLGDYQLDVPAIVLPLAVVAALAWGPKVQGPRSKVLVEDSSLPGFGVAEAPALDSGLWTRRATAAVFLVLAAIAAVLMGRSSVAHYLYAQERPASAARWDAMCGFYAFEQALAAEREGRQGAAREAYNRAAAAMPAAIPAAEQAGAALATAGAYREALPLLERAAALDYYFTLSHFHLGRTRLRLGDVEGAIDAFATSLLVQPATVFAEAWASPPERDVYGEALERAMDRLSDLAAFHPVLDDKLAMRRFNELAQFLVEQRSPAPSGSYRMELFELLDQDVNVNHSVFVFRRQGIPARIGTVPLLSPRQDPRPPAGIGSIRGVPSVRATDLQKLNPPQSQR